MAATSSGDERASFYESFSGDWDARLSRNELDKRLRLVFGRLLTAEDVRGRRVLDAGAGTGHFSAVLAGWGADLIAMESGEKLLAKVREKCAAETALGSVLDLPFPDERFDLVLCTEVIEHTTDPRRAVSELCRVVAPGGRLVLTVPNRLWKPAVLVANALKLRPYSGYENWVSYDDLPRWIEASGMSVETYRGFNPLPHTYFCRPAFDFLDDVSRLHPYMVNIAACARKGAFSGPFTVLAPS